MSFKEFQMSFYRTFIMAVAACGIATSVFAADTSDTQNVTDSNGVQQVADTQSVQGTEQKVDLNKASKKELMAVKGLSTAKVKAIISYRKKHGEFKSLDDLKEVKGFKKLNDEQLKSIQDQLTIG
jgi:comEA protein